VKLSPADTPSSKCCVRLTLESAVWVTQEPRYFLDKVPAMEHARGVIAELHNRKWRAPSRRDMEHPMRTRRLDPAEPIDDLHLWALNRMLLYPISDKKFSCSRNGHFGSGIGFCGRRIDIARLTTPRHCTRMATHGLRTGTTIAATWFDRTAGPVYQLSP
jgi:hypothetical protein